jgi:hypothetical protein
MYFGGSLIKKGRQGASLSASRERGPAPGRASGKTRPVVGLFFYFLVFLNNNENYFQFQ